MGVETILVKLGEGLFVLGNLAIIIGLPVLIMKYLIIRPILIIRKEMKGGKTFRQAWSEAFKGGDYSGITSGGAFSQSSDHQGTSITEYANNPLYSSMPGNTYRRH